MHYIRPAKPSDLSAIVLLDTTTNSSAWSQAWWQATLQSDHDTTMVATDENGCIIGVIVWQLIADEMELHLLATQPNFQRQGIASDLLTRLFESATTHGAARILLEVRQSNHGAQQLYTKHGFRTIATRAHYYRDGEDGLIMEKLC